MPGTKHTAQSIHDQIRGIDFLSFGVGLFDKDKFKPITADKVSLNKPRSGGFWACPVWTDDQEVPPRKRGYAWIDFLFTEISGSHKPEMDSGGCRFKLSPDARVLVIDSRDDLPRKYIHYKEESIAKNVIDFVAISQDYDAFLLTDNGVAEFRNRIHKNEVELPDWDFESLLIFNPEVVTDVRPLTQADNDILRDYLLSTYRTLSGEQSLLSVDDYDYVHSPEFKRFFGDWENDLEHASVILNERGEPLPLYHGSNRLFDRFDFSKLASNTGKTTWTPKDTGVTIEGDASRAMFFSSSLTQAISYSLLAQYDVFREKHSALSDLWPVFDHGTNMFIRDRKQFVSLMETVADDVPELLPIIQEMNGEPGKSFLRDILPAMDAERRKTITDAISEKRDALKESVSAMERGGLSNSYSSVLRQQKLIRTLEENVFPLMRNDLSVPNEFGTFEQYDCAIIGGSGNVEIWITSDENKRIRFQEKGKPAVYFDEINFDWIYNYFIPRIRACNKELLEKVNGEIERLGYNVNANIYKCFLKSTRPLEKDYEGSSYMDIYKGDENTPTAYIAALQVQEALDKGNDAVVYRNITDPFTSDSYGVFDASQILIAGVMDKITLGDENFKMTNNMANNDKNTINYFRGENFFLSNFATCKVVYEGVEYPSVENAYQAAKCKNVDDRKQFTSVTASVAKQMGKQVALREDWDSVKDEIMRELVNYKFNNNPDMRDKLLSTGNAALVEGNSWGDTYWGVDSKTGVGENKLGKILESVRESVKEGLSQPASVEKTEPVQSNNDKLNNMETVKHYTGDIAPADDVVFVFGSNPEGRHGLGAAKTARQKFGAVYGQGEGLQGHSYAIPTKDLRVKENNSYRSISPEAITESIVRMYECAREHPDKKFMVAYRNTDKPSLNGYTGIEMIQMFTKAGAIPENVYFSEEWAKTGLLGKIPEEQQEQAPDQRNPLIAELADKISKGLEKLPKKELIFDGPLYYGKEEASGYKVFLKGVAIQDGQLVGLRTSKYPGDRRFVVPMEAEKHGDAYVANTISIADHNPEILLRATLKRVNEEVKIRASKTLFILPAENNLFHETVRNILTKTGTPFIVAPQGFIFKADFKGMVEGIEKGQSVEGMNISTDAKIYGVDLVELGPSEPMPKNFVSISDREIDHLIDTSALSKILEITGYTPATDTEQRYLNMVSANNIAGIAGLQDAGASKDVIEYIRQQDRTLKGETPETRTRAKIALENRVELEGGDWAVVKVSNFLNDFTIIEDALYEKHNLVIFNDNQLFFRSGERADFELPQFTRLDQEERTLAELLEGILPKETDVEKLLASFESYKAELPANLSALDIYRLMKESVFPPEGVEADLDATVERINTALAPDWAKDKNENEIKAYLIGVFRDLPERGQQFLLSQTGLLQNNKALFYESHYDVYTTGFANKDLNTFMNTLPPDVEIVIDTRPRAYSINTPHFNKNSSNPDAVTFPIVLKEQGIEYIHIPETSEEFLPKLIEVINQHKGKVVIAGKENLASRSMRGQSLGPALERSGISVGHINQRYDKEKEIWLPTYSIQSQEETTKLLLRNYGVEIAEGSYKGVSFKEDKYFAEGVTLRKITHVERSDDRSIRGKWNYGQTVLTSQSDEPGLRAAVRDIAKQSNIVIVFTSNEKSAVANMTASAIKEAGADYVVVKIPKDKDELNSPEYAAKQFENLKDKIYRHLVSFDSNVTVGIIGDYMSKIKYRQSYAKVTEEELQQGSKALFFSEMGGYEAGNSIISIDSEIEQEDINAFTTNFMKAFNAKQEANEFAKEMEEPLFKATEIVALGETGAGIAGAIASQQLHINARLHLLKDGEHHVDDGTLNGRVIKDTASISNYLHQGYQASLSQDELILQIDNVRNAGENISGPGLKDRHILTLAELGFSNSDILTLAEQARVNGIYIHEREVITEGGLKVRTAAPALLELIEMCEEGYGVKDPGQEGRTIDTDNMFNVDHILQAEINVAKMLNNDRRNGIGTITIANPYYPAQLQAFAGYTDNKNEVDMFQYEGGISMVSKTVEVREERPAILRFKGNIEALSAPAVSLFSNTESEEISKGAANAIGHELGKAGVTIATSLRPTMNVSHETKIKQSQSVNNIQLITNAGEHRKTPGLKDRHILTLQNLGFSDVDILMMEDFSRTEGITLRTKEATEENDNGKKEKYLSSSTDLLAFINKCEVSLGIVPLRKITEESILRAERNATKLIDGEKLRGVGIITIANPYYEKMLENSNLLEKDGAQEASGMKQPILRYRPKTEEMTIVLNAVDAAAEKPVKKLVARFDSESVARNAAIDAGATSILFSPNGLNYKNDQDQIEKTIASGGVVLSEAAFDADESDMNMYKRANWLNSAYGSSVILLDGESLKENESEMKALSAAGGEVYAVDYKANDNAVVITPSIKGNIELLEMGGGSVKPDGSDLEGIIRHSQQSSVEDILDKAEDSSVSISNNVSKEESKKEVQVDSYKLTVVRCNDKQVFIVPETHKAVREALRKAYGEDIEFSENIALAKRNISGSVFKIDGENVRVPSNDSAPVFTENTVYTLPLWYKDGQIYSIYNAPIRARGELEPLNRRMRNKEAVDKFIAAAKEVRGDMMEKLGLPRGADIRFANAMHLVITQTSAEVYMGHSLIAGIRLSNSGSLTLINKAPYNRDFKESDMEYLFHDDASDRKAEEERYHHSLFFDDAEAVENINSKVATIRDEAIDKLIEKMREKIVGINGADAENLDFADADLTQAVKEGIIAEPSAEKKEEFDRAVAYACLQQEEAKHAKSIKALKKDAKALTSEIADKTAERDKAVSDAMAPEIIARTEETLNEKIESRQTIENKIDRLRSQIAILQVQKEKLIFAEKVLKSSSVQEGTLEKINLSVDGLMLSVAPGALSKKVDLDAVRQEMSSIKDKREEQVRAFAENIDKIENQSIQIINITKSYDEHQGTSAVGVARREEIVPDSLSNGRYIIERDGKQAYADEQLNIRSDFFDSVKKWRGDKGLVCKDGKYNYVGVSGELIVSVWFDKISRQSEGLSIVTIDDSYGLVGESGELVGGRTFANVRPCSDGWAVVQGGFEDGENMGKFNYINADGKFMKRKWLDQASDFQNGIATVVVNGVQKTIDKKGSVIKPDGDDSTKKSKGNGRSK